jgi:hypothetical protein
MHKTILKLLLASAWAMLLGIAGTAFGQGVTTSGITGVVTDKQGNPVGGATVVATHQPSGTTATTTTRSNGHYDLSGLRIGGPYSVTVSGASVQSNTQGSIFVGLDHPETVDFNLAAEVVTLAAVSVSESKDTTFDPDKMGTATTYDTLQIAEIPTVRRDVQDLANQDTRIGLTTNTSTGEFSMSAQGQNSRYNSFLIDGQQSNDPFGLNANGFTSLRSPVPLDALEALTIDFSPYDVTHTGFTGVLINAVTKSGTNEFHGDVYSYFSDTRLRAPNPGQSPTDPNAGAHDPYSQHTYGFTLGGPIIKNKLFFFVAFDDYMKTGLPYSPIVFAPTGSVLASVIATAQGYGIAPGSIGSKVDSDQKTYLAKLDWNINNLHRLSLIYRRTDSSAPVYSNGSSYIELSSNAYQSNRINDNLSALLNSTWTPNISSEIGLSASRYNGTASLYEPLAPEIYVNGVTGTNLTTGAALTNGQIDLGTNHSYQFNALYTDDYNGHLYANYSWLDHTFKVGADFDKTIVLDDFVQYYTGLYGFASPAAFAAGTPNYIRYQQASPGFTIGQANYYYSFINTGLLAQDTWKPSESLTVVGGIRLDEPFFPTKPLYLPSFQTAFGIPNNTVPNDDFSFEPRIGFNYQLPLPAKLSKWKAQVRGGIGLFQGTNPAVWVGDAYGNTGALNSVISGSSNASATNPPLAAPYSPFNPSNGYVQSLAPPGAPTPSINLVSPSFRPPTSWKSNLALDVSLPWYDLKATIEGDFIQVDKGIYWQNINLNPTGVLAPDGRTLYSSTALNTGFSRTGVYELLNTNQGGSQSYTYQIARPLKNHWAFSAGYTHTHATDVQPLTSSVASSNYNYRAVINPNDNVAHNSAYVVPNKYTFSATYEAHFFEMKNTATRVTGIFRMQPGTAYSWVFSNDVNNDGTNGNDAFYVPNGPNDPKVTWSTSASDPTGSIQAAAFWSFVNSSDLKKYEGQIAPPFSSFNPWQQTIDMHLEQDIPLTYGNMKFTLFADCLNFANLFNKHWGIVSGMDFGTGPNSGYNRGVASATINASNQYVYTFSANTLTSLQTFTDLSRYQIQLGAKISF